MLTRLFIKNFVLIESLSVELGVGLNIITGETGAGKTALLDAIALILGMRADTGQIRKGEEKALIEAAFEVDKRVISVLEEAGISHDPDEWLVIRREIVRNGKNRAFINGQITSLPILQEIGKLLIDLFSQHSHQTLRQTGYHRHLLDLFADLRVLLEEYQQALKEEKELTGEIEELEASRENSEREIAYHSHVVEEIEAADLKEGEDESVFEDYSRCAHASELLEALSSCAVELTESPESLLTRLTVWKQQLRGLLSYDKRIEGPLELLEASGLQLTEAAREISSLLTDIDSDPLHMDLLKQRLNTFDKLKKKYGKTFEAIQETKKDSESVLRHFETLDEKLAALRKAHGACREKTDALAKELSKGRKTAASHLGPMVTEILHTLNMEGSAFSVKVTSALRTTFGDEEIAFFLKANSGEQEAPVASRSSGGELARLMLAITTILAEKNATDTLLFDEIDANIGGETATKIGATLANLGKTRQVLCITHFPQVASFANHHFRVHKETIGGRTVAHIAKLTGDEKKEELTRMLGGSFPKSPHPVC